jgi:8-oxo-dGTP pyrophosphatase MutT (NUDIX family)
MPSPQQLFFNALSPRERQVLQSIVVNARHAPPADCVRWFCGPVFLGWISPERAMWLGRTLERMRFEEANLIWDAYNCSAEDRSAQLQAALEAARSSGLLNGWRNERFSFWAQADAPYFLSVERSGFRFLGMMSHAVHINGLTPQGHLWCGRRALSKPTDPGMLDNVTAGGLPTGESALDCALRELEEEAGITGLAPQAVVHAGAIRTARTEPQGYHDELLHVFNLVLPAECVPANRDGEVSEFICFPPGEVLKRIERGEFTADAVAALAQGMAGLTSS